MLSQPNGWTEFPVMRPGSLDYVDGAYSAKVERTDHLETMEVRHSVNGNNLVTQLITQGNAIFATEVAAPYSTYREIVPFSERVLSPSKPQIITWDKDQAISPVYLRPVVIVSPDFKSTRIKLSVEHGVHSIWQGREIEIFPAAILAADTFWNAKDFMADLFKVKKDENLREGEIVVDAFSAEGFYLSVKLAPKLFEAMRHKGAAGSAAHRKAIFTLALTAGLQEIEKNYKENWQEYPALRTLDQIMKKKGVESWDSDGFSAALAASKLLPLEMGDMSARGGDDVEDD